ncbi:MAG: peptide chain release factor N(5)-glutamine methyltransferase [Opitutales bacterium]|nr:peptide chain release factor N(5)-glutamine methyltransferase [Opitutales bacterium]
MQSVIEILKKCEEFFAQKGVPNPKLDAQLLLAHAMKCKRLDLFLRFEEPITNGVLSEFREYARRRAKREPLQHILGFVDFCGLNLKCDARALIPRPETEELCDILTRRLKANPPKKILDLGTGSGAIILSLKNAFKDAECAACDISSYALSLARENAERTNLSVNFFESDWLEKIPEGEKFDLIVSNPPYLTKAEVESAQAEVRLFDPIFALESPDEGAKDLRKIIEGSPKFLAKGGLLALECGIAHPKMLAQENASNADFSNAEIMQDLSGRDRFLIFTRA